MAEWWSSAFPLLLIAAALFINEWITMPTCTTSGHRSNAGMRRSGDLRVMMVSDLLLGGPDTDLAKRLIRQTFMSKALRKSVEMVRPDMIVVLGDLSAGGSDSEVEKWLGELQEFQWMLGPYVGLPLYVVLGERDMGRCGELDEGFIGGIAGYLPGMDSAGCGAFEMKNVTFVSLNGVALQCKEGQLRFGVERVIERKSMELRSRVQEVDANGDFGVDVFQWRDNRVEPGSGPVVLVHFPLHHRGVDYAGGTSSTEDDFWIASSRAFGSYNDGVIVGVKQYESVDSLPVNATQYIIHALKPRIVFSAHTHSFHDQIHSDGTREVTVPALTWAPGKATSSDLRKVVEILSYRNSDELKLIVQSFHVLYNQDLCDLTSRKSSLLSKVANLRTNDHCFRDASMINQALFGTNLDVNVVMEIICTRSSSDLKVIKQTYYNHYNSHLEQHVSVKTNGSFQEVLLAFLNSAKHEIGRTNTSMAMCDAKTLYEAIGSGKSVDKTVIISLISQRNTSQLKIILQSYKQLYGHDLMKFLKIDKCGEFGRHLRTAMRCVQYPEKHFARQLRLAMKDGDHVGEVLIRTVVTRAGIDIKCINRVFAEKTGCSLESLIRKAYYCDGRNDCDHKGLVGDVLIALL